MVEVLFTAQDTRHKTTISFILKRLLDKLHSVEYNTFYGLIFLISTLKKS